MAASSPSCPAWLARFAQMKRRGGKPPPIRPPQPLMLANQVSNRRLRLGEATCITEMSLMMACWKQNEFNDSICAKEIQAFFECSSKAEAERKEKILQDSLGRSGKLSSKQVNKLISRFPNITHYY
ncbi:coiled-coil-helix-coiled-coil-helix domain-containing protein 1 [Eublepharis macularius]|uniref:Coiled-coil-helix-coiled-coil-helix domain-containing protein 1 n=1 Tax=Eublepharis macularius TaxID=481883 RepID=A0AA97L1Y1_EUBMA|nr:coiled-coil-helix-coiled-coil-helix domain-containing protein 1 [Eublepharis macularius]